MSRLDSAIRRLEAQRACLAHAAALIGGRPGPVLEIGLGNGRTFDHLREVLPDREIVAFDRQLAAHPDCVPAADRLILGDLRETLPRARTRFAGRAMLAHLDLGSGAAAADARLAALVAALLPPLMAPHAVIASDQPLAMPGWAALPLPAGVAAGRYHLYRQPAFSV